MGDHRLDDQELAAIDKAAEVIAMHATGGEPKVSPNVMTGGIATILPPIVSSFIDGLRHLLSLDDRMMRACVIVESQSPLNTSQVHQENLEIGEILVSFGIAQEGPDDLQFINFGLNVDEDLSSLAALYSTITAMEDQLSGILDGKLNPDGSEITGGEDQ